MATKKVYDACCRALAEQPLYSISHKRGFRSKRIRRPNMKFLFGKKELVSEVQLSHCSEAEKRRHLLEDHVLRSTYIELYAHGHPLVNDPGSAALSKDSE